jgi:acetylglutamate kinase
MSKSMRAIALKGEQMKKIVIKCGGSILARLTGDFFDSLRNLNIQGYQIIFVHGGGPEISERLKLKGIESEFVQGLRKTDERTLETAEMILSGQSNRKLADLLQQNGFNALGLNGSDSILRAEFLDQEKLGFVGRITHVSADLLHLLLENGYLPVLTPLAKTEEGMRLNVNADYAAAAVALAVDAEQCLFVTDVDGIKAEGALLEKLDDEKASAYIQNGTISGGMIPKVESALAAIRQGVKSVRIISGVKRFYTGDVWGGTQINCKERTTV